MIDDLRHRETRLLEHPPQHLLREEVGARAVPADVQVLAQLGPGAEADLREVVDAVVANEQHGVLVHLHPHVLERLRDLGRVDRREHEDERGDVDRLQLPREGARGHVAGPDLHVYSGYMCMHTRMGHPGQGGATCTYTCT
eukprot:CAMPEP_0170184080 /NCGR_PEP_ID=MMETSP0040_2-20121228/32649_1 /TAXON_ID=641309 /ORGANISM="Lotharella oceanica, Strain CCMP622" /LENGTH=140 /DNA_ID=CAMNT_0010430023 /DNA_START=121 /DNA_END=539 /DNA_ORIENTATION=+